MVSIIVKPIAPKTPQLTSEVYVSMTSSRKEVATAGTRVPLAAASTPCKLVVITAETNNTGNITVGGNTVVAAEATRVGTPLAAGDSYGFNIDNLTKVYIDSTVNTDGVTFDYFT
ncbi:unnamed protein product [marine sediment metagenome]|uniref:Uncharacterized protein n=1 Tax=marine sediment metagenome TaxID=412755 RepID=X1M767_9ZZZZ